MKKPDHKNTCFARLSIACMLMACGALGALGEAMSLPNDAVLVTNGFYQSAATYANSTDFYITNLDGLKYFRDMINADANEATSVYIARGFTTSTITDLYSGNIFGNKIIHLLADIDLGNVEWEPIGINKTRTGGNPAYSRPYLQSVFDGHDHTVSNLYFNDTTYADKFGLGLFGYMNKATVRNLRISNVNFTGYRYIGALIGNAGTSVSTIENCHVTGSISISGNRFMGGLMGHGCAVVTNCSVVATGNAGTIAGSYWQVGGIAGTCRESTRFVDCTVQNVNISAGDNAGVSAVGGIVGNLMGDVIACTVSDVQVTSTGSAKGAIVGRIDATVGAHVLENMPKTAGQCGTSSTNAIVGWNIVGTLGEGGITGGIYENLQDINVANGYVKKALGTTPETWQVDVKRAAKIGETQYTTLAEAIAAAALMDASAEKVIQLLEGTITEEIKLPSTLKNVTFRGADGGKSILKDMTIMSYDGNEYTYENIWFDAVVFDNSRLVVTGMRAGTEVNKNWKFTNNTFTNLTQEGYSYLHFASLSAEEPAENFIFVSNVVDGSTFANCAALNISSLSGEITFIDNAICNLPWRPMNIQVNNHDGLADTLTVRGNTFAGCGREPQMLTRFADGTDAFTVRINLNIFANNHPRGFVLAVDNPSYLNADVTHNYYASTITKIYYPDRDVYFPFEVGNLPHQENTYFSYYTGLLNTEMIDLATLVTVPAYAATVISGDGTQTNGCMTLALAMAQVQDGGAIVVLHDNSEQITTAPTATYFTFNSQGYSLAGGSVAAAEGYAFAREDNICTYGKAMVQIGSKAYLTLASAIASATDDDVITLLDSLTEDLAVPDGKSVTFDGGAYVLTGTLSVGEGASLVLLGGTFTANPLAYLGDGKAARDNGDGTWSIVSASVKPIEQNPEIGTVTDTKGNAVSEAQQEQANSAVETLKTNLVESVADPVVVGVDSGIAEVVANNEDLIVTLLKQNATEQGLTEGAKKQIEKNIADFVDDPLSTSSSSNYLTIAVTTFDATVKSVSEEAMEATPAKVVYDVTPIIETVVSNTVGGVTTMEVVSSVIPNDTVKEMADNGSPITFNLKILDESATRARVRHISSETNKYPVETFTCPVWTQGTGRYITVTVSHFSIFEVECETSVACDSDATISILKVNDFASGEKSIGVPFTKSGVATSADVTLDEFVVTGAATGDKAKAWTAGKGDRASYGAKSTTDTLPVGSALWYKRANASSTPVALAGYVATNQVETAVAAPASDASGAGMTLFTNPYRKAIDNVLTKLSGTMADGDRIVLEGGTERYLRKNGVWYKLTSGLDAKTNGAIVIRGGTTQTAVTSIPLDAGQAFWYVSAGGTPKIAW